MQTLPCSHTFHRACVNRIRMTIGVQQACPICRRRLPPNVATLITRAWDIFAPIQHRVINGAPLTRRERQQMNEVVRCWEEAAESAAEQGNNIGQLNMAILYNHGWFLNQNYDAAAEFFTKAAKQGDAKAQHYLAIMHYFGNSVEQSIHTAIKWFTVAAEKGDIVESYKMLGRIYLRFAIVFGKRQAYLDGTHVTVMNKLCSVEGLRWTHPFYPAETSEVAPIFLGPA